MSDKQGNTIRTLVDRVHTAAVGIGIDLSPRDVAFIVSTFLEGLALAEPKIEAVDRWLNMVADEVNSVRDE